MCIRDSIINVPLTAGSGSAELREAWREDIEPALQQFKPQLILISAGFDAHYLDPVSYTHLDVYKRQSKD